MFVCAAVVFTFCASHRWLQYANGDVALSFRTENQVYTGKRTTVANTLVGWRVTPYTLVSQAMEKYRTDPNKSNYIVLLPA